MYFSDAIATILRRWVIVVVGLLVAVGLGLVVISIVPTRYQATAEVLILPPSRPVQDGDRANAYMGLPNALTSTTTLVGSSLMSLETQGELTDLGYASEYNVAVVPGAGPLLSISVTDTDADAALALRDVLNERVESELRRLQSEEDVPLTQYMTTRVFNANSEAEVLAGSRIRALAAVLAATALVTAFAVFGVERMATRKARTGVLNESSTEDGHGDAESGRITRRLSGRSDMPRAGQGNGDSASESIQAPTVEEPQHSSSKPELFTSRHTS